MTARYGALARDIYSSGLARRPVYEVRAEVAPGNAGGPLVDLDGEVGVVFSRSALHRESASPFALERLLRWSRRPATCANP